VTTEMGFQRRGEITWGKTTPRKEMKTTLRREVIILEEGGERLDRRRKKKDLVSDEFQKRPTKGKNENAVGYERGRLHWGGNFVKVNVQVLKVQGKFL